MKASGIGVGSNPTVWFAAGTIILVIVRYFLDRKEDPMKANKSKAVLMKAMKSSIETFWALAANITVGLVTISIH